MRDERNLERTAILMCAGDYEPMEIPVGRPVAGAAGGSVRSAAGNAVRRAEGRCDQIAAGSPVRSAAGDPAREGVLVVAVDGGLPRLLGQGIEPDLVVGDFDSLCVQSAVGYASFMEELERAHPERLLRLPVEKDDTDTVYAARLCLERGYRRIVIYGALGGRLDHTVANLQTLAFIRERGGRGFLLAKRPGAARPAVTLATVISAERLLVPEGFEGTFSIFSMDRRIGGVTLEGMKYPLRDASLGNAFPLGVSNEVSAAGGAGAYAEVRSGTALVVLETEQDESVLWPGRVEIRSLRDESGSEGE